MNQKVSLKNPGGGDSGTCLWEAVSWVIVIVVVLLIYLNALKGPFVFDDQQNIEKNPHIRLTELSLQGIAKAGFESPLSTRPIAYISFALNHYFHQDNVVGYHLVNVWIHIATGILLFFFLKFTLSLRSVYSRCDPTNRWIPLCAAFIWLVHPVQTQAVSYVVQRMTSLSAMFYILALLCYVKGRLAEGKKQAYYFVGCAAAWALALGSKEIAATLPFFILLYEWYFFRDLRMDWIKRRLPVVIVTLILMGLLCFFYVGSDPMQKILSSYEHRDFTLPERVLTEFRVVVFYASLLFFPHPSRLNLEHDFTISHSLVDPITTLFSFFLIVGLLTMAVCWAKRQRLVSFCILWFFGNLLIESSVIGLELVFEHRLYLPSMFVSLMAVIMVWRCVKPLWLKAGVICTVGIICALWTFERNHVWGDSVALGLDTVTKSPNKPRAHFNLGVALGGRNRLEEAIDHYLKALEIRPDYVDARNNLGAALVRRGNPDEAIKHYGEVLKVKPHYAKVYFNLGAVLTDQGRLGEAVQYYARALEIQPDYAEAHNNMGSTLAKQGKTAEAEKHFTRALELQPEDVEVRANLAAALAKHGKLDQAIDQYVEALRLAPNDENLYYSLGGVMASKGDYDEAMGHFLRGLQLRPTAKAHYNLGVMLAQQGKYEEAMGHFLKASKMDPGHTDARYNLRALREFLDSKGIPTTSAKE
jgi:protein O-mannosyl-transferase